MDIEKYIAEINPHEMALRIAEACIGVKRKAGYTPEALLKEMRLQYPDEVVGFYRAAWAAAKYLEESINDYKKVN